MALVRCPECRREVSNPATACPGCGAKLPRSQRALAAILSTCVIVGLMAMCSGREERPADAEVQARLQASAIANARTACERDRSGQTQKYEGLLQKRQFWEASLAFGNCADLLGDDQLKGKIKDARITHYLVIARDSKATLGARAFAVSQLEAIDASAIQPRESKTFADLKLRAARAEQAEAANRLAALKAERRKQGVTIGMSAEEVLQSSWGKPNKVNRTTYATRTKEQWVYGGGNYLYFDDGVLTAIQN